MCALFPGKGFLTGNMDTALLQSDAFFQSEYLYTHIKPLTADGHLLPRHPSLGHAQLENHLLSLGCSLCC